MISFGGIYLNFKTLYVFWVKTNWASMKDGKYLDYHFQSNVIYEIEFINTLNKNIKKLIPSIKY